MISEVKTYLCKLSLSTRPQRQLLDLISLQIRLDADEIQFHILVSISGINKRLLL